MQTQAVPALPADAAGPPPGEPAARSRRAAWALGALGAAALALCFRADLFTLPRAVKILAAGGDALAVTDDYLLVQCWWLAPVALVPWALLVARTGGRLWLSAFAFGLFFDLWAMGWLAEVTAGGYLFGAFMAAWLLVIWAVLLKALRRRTGWPFALLVPWSWVAVELLREHWPISFPWFHLGYALAACDPLLQTADLWGVFGLSALAAAASGAALDVVLAVRPGWEADRRRGAGGAPVRWRRSAIAVAALWAAALGYGAWRGPAVRAALVEGPACLLVQPNVPQEAKETGAQPVELFLAPLHLTLAGLAEHPETELVIWPETALPEYDGADLPRYRGALSALARDHGVALAVGALALRFDPERGRFRAVNELRVFDAAGREAGRYVKQRLAPGSEEVPLARVFPWFPGLVMRWFGYVPDTWAGDEAPVLALPGAADAPGAVPADGPARFGALICYDAAYPMLARDPAADGAEFFVCLSNDGWFHGSGELDQMHAMALVRAVETRKGIARATNTGLTALLDADGAVRMLRAPVKPEAERRFVLRARGGLPGDRRRFAPVGTETDRQVEGVLFGRVRTLPHTTFFVAAGWLLAPLAALAALAALCWPRRRARNRSPGAPRTGILAGGAPPAAPVSERPTCSAGC